MAHPGRPEPGAPLPEPGAPAERGGRHPARALLTRQGLGMSAAGVVARMPISMLGLGLVLLVHSGTGSYGLGGAVAATFALAQAAGSPWVSRQIDRRGQAAVAIPAYLVHAGALLALVALAVRHAVAGGLIGAAALAGASFTSVGVLVRARWTYLVPGRRALQLAYTLESVLDEAVFVIGPVLVTLLAVRVDRTAGVLVALGLNTVGLAALLAQRGSQPPAHAVAGGGRQPSALRLAGLRVLAAAGFGMGGIFGSVEVATVAFAGERGGQGQAGPVLALLALGSMVGGIGYGLLPSRGPLHRRFALSGGALGLAVLVLPLAVTVPELAAACFGCGLMAAPTLIGAFALVERLVPVARLNEGMTWIGTGLGLGVALGNSLAGQVADRHGGRPALAVTAAAGVLTLAVVAAGRRAVRPAGAG